MMSRNSCSKGLVRDCMKRNLWAIVLSTVGFFMAQLLPVIDTVEFDYPTFHLSMDCFWCQLVRGNLELLEAAEARWLTRETLKSVEWLPADSGLIEKIEKALALLPS